MNKMVDDAAFNKSAEKIGRFLPAGAYTAFQYIAAQITTDGTCDHTQRDFFIVFMGILAATSTILAVTQRLRGEIKESKQTTTALICLFRAVGSTAIFLSLAILTPPGPTCLFPNPDPSAKEGSIIPRYTNACVCTTLVVVFSALTHKFNFVTDSKNEPDVAGEPHIPPGPDAEAGMAGAGDQDHPANDANLDHNGINDHHHEDLLEPLVPQPEAGPPEPPL